MIVCWMCWKCDTHPFLFTAQKQHYSQRYFHEMLDTIKPISIDAAKQNVREVNSNESVYKSPMTITESLTGFDCTSPLTHQFRLDKGFNPMRQCPVYLQKKWMNPFIHIHWKHFCIAWEILPGGDSVIKENSSSQGIWIPNSGLIANRLLQNNYYAQ